MSNLTAFFFFYVALFFFLEDGSFIFCQVFSLGEESGIGTTSVRAQDFGFRTKMLGLFLPRRRIPELTCACFFFFFWSKQGLCWTLDAGV
jgi:hypothetical protein